MGIRGVMGFMGGMGFFTFIVASKKIGKKLHPGGQMWTKKNFCFGFILFI